MKRIVASLVFAALTGCGGMAPKAPTPPPPPLPVNRPLNAGGTNYSAASVNGPAAIGLVQQYHLHPVLINGQLQAMYASGLRRLRLFIWHYNGANAAGDTVNVESTGGTLQPQQASNLAALLAQMKATGFQEVTVAFGPEGGNSPLQWTSWQESVYQENWNLIVNTRRILVASGMPYVIDLCNEAIPPTGFAVLQQYAQRLWADYTFAFGKADTYGFSLIPDADRVSHLAAVYQGNYPTSLAIHFYGPQPPYTTTYDEFVGIDKAVKATPLAAAPWRLDEAYYNDAQEALDLQRAMQTTQRQVLCLLQWWILRDGTQVQPPYIFDNYAARGF